MTGLAARRLAQLRLAIMLLSRLPVGRLRDPIPTLAEARWAYPLVGLVIGTLGWAVLQGALQLGLPDGVAAVAMLGAMALATGGLHHDGLADFADGIGGGRDRDHALAIMKDSRIGSYGALALILGVGLAATGLASMAQTLTLGGLLLVAVASRLAMLGVLMALPPARADGLGQGAAGGSGLGAAVPGAVIALALCVLLGGAGWAALAVMAATAMAVAGSAKTRLGGQTGDVLGAVQILCETAGWIALAAALA